MSSGSDRVLDRLMSLHPKIIDLKLERVERLLATLGHPERRLPPVVHIAGTNGKGSVLAMTRAGLEAMGWRVHAYTSPHLTRFSERIVLGGVRIDEDRLIALLEQCEEANAGAPITFFEITTCAAFLAFAETPAEAVLLEVGLGGRLDATNVLKAPALCVITAVSLDHQQYLGETLTEIAGEKAGIIKRSVPCVVGPQPDEVRSVIETRADKLAAPLSICGQDWQVWEEHGRMVYQDQSGLLDLPLPRLIGAHQVQNAGTAIAALRQLGAGEEACAAATQAEWPARLQRLKAGPLVEAAGNAELWLDGGHNPAAGAALSEALGRLPARPLYLLTGMLNTKDVAGFLRPLAHVALGLFGVSIPGEAATLAASETVAAAHEVGLRAWAAETPAAAIAAITAQAPRARIVICGSLYLAGRVLSENS